MTEDLSVILIEGVHNGSLRCEVQGRSKRHRVFVRILDGAVACDCESFQFRCKSGYPSVYSGKVCRHISAFRERLQAEVIERGGASKDILEEKR